MNLKDMTIIAISALTMVAMYGTAYALHEPRVTWLVELFR